MASFFVKDVHRCGMTGKLKLSVEPIDIQVNQFLELPKLKDVIESRELVRSEKFPRS